MLPGEEGAGCDTFRLEPDDALHAPRMPIVRYLAQPAGKPVCVYLPGAGVWPTGGTVLRIVNIPASIHPPVIERQLFLQIPLDEEFLTVGIGVNHFAELMRT